MAAGNVRGKMLRDADIPLAQKATAGSMTADATGRAVFADSFFDLTTVGNKFASGAIADAKLVESYIKANGTRAFTANQSVGGFILTNHGSPSNSTDVANKAYVDAIGNGLTPKASVRAATTRILDLDSTTPQYDGAAGASLRGQITFTTGPTTIDGVTLADGDRVLVKNEGDGSGLGADANGIWVRTSANTWDRATDFDTDAEVRAGSYMPVTEGTANSDQLFLLTTNNPIVIGGASGTDLTFTNFGSLTLGGTTPTTIQPDDVAAEGTASRASRTDHKHAVVCGAPSVTVKSEATAAAEGSATSFIRSDAQFTVATASPSTTVKSDAASPSQGSSSSLLRADAQLVILTGTPSNVGNTNAQGSSQSMPRLDHTHAVPTHRAVIGPDVAAIAASSNYAKATDSTFGKSIALKNRPVVKVNGSDYSFGYDRTSYCFFASGDNGTTARAEGAVASGDTLHINRDNLGFDLDTNDRITVYGGAFDA